MLETLGDPASVVAELRRVTKRGGVVGAASVEYGGLILAGEQTAGPRHFYDIRQRLWRVAGIAEPNMGRRLRGLFQEAGFGRVEAFADYISYGTPYRVMTSSPDGDEFRGMVKRAGFYIAIATIGHLFWETAQLPFYTVWWDGMPRENLVAVAHCTSGAVLITATTLLIAALVARLQAWRLFGRRMVLTTIVLGVGYTMLSEWLNVEVLRSWSYSSLMPVLPWSAPDCRRFSSGSPYPSSRSA